MNRYWVVDLHRFGQHHFGKLFHLPLPMGICSNKPNFSEPLGSPKQKTTNKGLLVTKVTAIAVKLLVLFLQNGTILPIAQLPWPCRCIWLPKAGLTDIVSWPKDARNTEVFVGYIYIYIFFHHMPNGPKWWSVDCYFAQGCLWKHRHSVT